MQYGRYDKFVRERLFWKFYNIVNWQILNFIRHLSDVRAYDFSINLIRT